MLSRFAFMPSMSLAFWSMSSMSLLWGDTPSGVPSPFLAASSFCEISFSSSLILDSSSPTSCLFLYSSACSSLRAATLACSASYVLIWSFCAVRFLMLWMSSFSLLRSIDDVSSFWFISAICASSADASVPFFPGGRSLRSFATAFSICLVASVCFLSSSTSLSRSCAHLSLFCLCAFSSSLIALVASFMLPRSSFTFAICSSRPDTFVSSASISARSLASVAFCSSWSGSLTTAGATRGSPSSAGSSRRLLLEELFVLVDPLGADLGLGTSGDFAPSSGKDAVSTSVISCGVCVVAGGVYGRAVSGCFFLREEEAGRPVCGFR
mmetsp:Transcript_23341/g.58517  ORF Transcript_23341/g.58517 Transcript_23341/m.58517 type:complete len:324 (+) Transcript_23341:722-1693(+)